MHLVGGTEDRDAAGTVIAVSAAGADPAGICGAGCDAHPPSWPGVFAFAQMGVQSFGNGSRLYALDAHLQPVL
jgi:hypothetical protein